MSYLTISNIARSTSLTDRVAACAAQEGESNPQEWAWANALVLAASPGWAAAWESALASDPNTDPGDREDVITDGMILSAVQALQA